MQGSRRGAGAPGTEERIGNTGAVLRRLLPYLGPFRVRLLGVLVLVIVYALVQAAGPALTGQAIDVYIIRKDALGLSQTMLLLLGVYLVGYVAQSGQAYLVGSVGQRFLANLRTQIFDKVQALSLAFFDSSKAGDLMSRLVNDISTINQLFSQGITQVIGSVFSLVGIVIAMIVLSPRLSLVSFVVLPVMIWTTVFFAQRSRVAFRETRTAIGELSSTLEEEIVGVRVAQAFNRIDANIRHFTEHNAANRDANVHAVVVTSAFTPAIVAGFGGWLALNHQIAVGTVVAFFFYVQQFFRPIQIISTFSTQMQAALAGAERIFDLVGEPAEQQDTPGAKELPPIVGRVAFEHVNFTYDQTAKDVALVLRDINLEARPGQTMALVGQTGAGKSTLVNLIPRFYDVTSGRATIDGHDVREVTLSSLRKPIGFMLQDTYLFSGTIADNIRYGRLDASDTEVEEAAKAASIHEVILSQPQGYQTRLGERGRGLSQGQRQLIAFARTLLADPRILILDEATSSVDTRTEELIQQALKRLLKDRTAFVIAHRLSTVRDANMVLVIEGGQIVERGTHAELLARGGRYAELYERQFRQSNPSVPGRF